MVVRSLQIRTDLALRNLRGEVVAREGYIAVRTPSNPTFRWGNCLVFPSPPATGDVAAWDAVFAREFADVPGVVHRAYTWDSPDGARGASAEFEDAGFHAIETLTLTCTRAPRSRRPPAACEMRALHGDDDWQAWMALAAAQNAAEPPDRREGPGYREFLEATVRDRRAVIATGRLRWFGAFVDGALVSSMGLFIDGDAARFQSVDTHPAHRGRGYATTLLCHVGREGLARMGARILVIVAEAGEQAHRLYEAAGFSATERIVELDLPVAPRSDVSGSGRLPPGPKRAPRARGG